MPIYVVSYDLNKAKNYDALWKALDELDGRRVLYSQWAVRAKGDAAALRDYLLRFMDTDDSLLVMDRDSGDWAAIRLRTKLGDYKA